jgi:hypothetical protein
MSSTIIGTLPVTLQNGTTADAAAVMANFNYIVSQVNTNAGTGGGLQSVFKQANQSISLISVVQADQELFFAAAASKVYVFKLHISFTNPLVSGFKFKMFGTALSGLSNYLYNGYWDSGSGGAAQAGLPDSGGGTWPVTGAAFTPSTSTNGWIEIHGITHIITAGNVGFYWSQNVAGSSAAIVLAGSYLEYAPIV